MAELGEKQELVEKLMEIVHKKPLTLVYSAKKRKIQSSRGFKKVFGEAIVSHTLKPFHYFYLSNQSKIECNEI